MKFCKSCGGSGSFFGGPNPIRFATCIVCRGHGTTIPFMVGNIRMHNLGSAGEAQSFLVSDFPAGALMAHAMHRAGIFSSITQARKNGWDKPIEKGTFVVTKKKIQIILK